MKGRKRLQTSIGHKDTSYIGRRHMLRLCSDAYGKGIVRSNQESVNLRVSGTPDDVTSAEFIHTASSTVFPGKDLTKWREAVYQHSDYVDMLSAVSVDWRNPHRRTPAVRYAVFMYGHRPRDYKALWNLSAYEFVVYWRVEPATYALHADHDTP